MTFEDSQKMMIVSQSVDIRHEESILWGEFRQTLGEIRADVCEVVADFERDSRRILNGVKSDHFNAYHCGLPIVLL